MHRRARAALAAVRRFYDEQLRLQQAYPERHLYCGRDAVDARAGRLLTRL